jgi:hypothetical protein
LSNLLLTSIHLPVSLTILLISLGRGRSQFASTTWERERAGSDESLCLGGVGRVGLYLIHLEEVMRFL